MSKSASKFKNRQGDLRQLEDELAQSRLAVEAIDSCKSPETFRNRELESIQSDLQNTMLKIGTEEKKNKVLVELIALLKGEMFRFQTQEKKREEQEERQHFKKVKKVQYDIEQILQKHNEQVAKINQLKEEASSCRSQRVVYSNLFKKLEKEIKDHEEIYKENLLRTEVAQLTQRQASSRNTATNLNHTIIHSDPEDEEDEMASHYIPARLSQVNNIPKASLHLQQPHPGANISSVSKESRNEQSGSKVPIEPHSTPPSQTISQFNWTSNSKTTSKGLNESVSEYQRTIQIMKKICQIQSVDKMVAYYSSVEDNNETLLGQIDGINRQIDRIEKQIDNERSQHKTKITDSQKIIGDPNDKNREQDISSLKQQSLRQLFAIMNVPLPICDGSLRLLNWKLEQMELSVVDEKPSNVSVDHLLDSVMPPKDCERIFDRNSFEREYREDLKRRASRDNFKLRKNVRRK